MCCASTLLPLWLPHCVVQWAAESEGLGWGGPNSNGDASQIFEYDWGQLMTGGKKKQSS